MRITKRQLRRIIKEACELSAQSDPHEVSGIDNPSDHYSAEVPSPEDYDRVRDFLNQNSSTVDLGISMVMSASGAGCERSTAQGIIDHLKDMLHKKGSQVDARPNTLTHDAIPMMVNLSTI